MGVLQHHRSEIAGEVSQRPDADDCPVADSKNMGAQDSPSAIVSAEFEVFGKVQGSYHNPE
jgi:hypothetical protein